MNDKFSKDLYRYYGEKGESFVGRLLRPTELKYIALFRKTEKCNFKPLKLYYTVKLKLMSHKTHIQIPARTKIGAGFCIQALCSFLYSRTVRLSRIFSIL